MVVHFWIRASSFPLREGFKMQRKAGKIFSIVFLLFLSGSFFHLQHVDSQDQKNFLWRVQSQTATVYLLGSIHFMKRELYPLPQRIEGAFDHSGVLAIGANINDLDHMDAQPWMGRAYYPGQEGIEDHLSGETYERVKKESERLGLSLRHLRKRKPWFLAFTLTGRELARMGFDPRDRLDKYFLSKATGRKKIIEIESLEEQVHPMSSLSDEDQELFLLSTIEDLPALKEEVDRLLRIWSTGDLKGMESLSFRDRKEDRRSSPAFEKIVYDRNQRMISKVEDFLRTGETYFVIVGAGHLLGGRGMIEMLKEKGYRVEQF